MWVHSLNNLLWNGEYNYTFIGAKPGLLTNENKKAFGLYWDSQLETNKQNGKKESQTISGNWDEGEYL